MADVKPSADDF